MSILYPSYLTFELNNSADELNEQIKKINKEPRLSLPISSKPKEFDLPTPRSVSKALLELPNVLKTNSYVNMKLLEAINKLDSTLSIPTLPESPRNVITKESRLKEIFRTEQVGQFIQGIKDPLKLSKPDFLKQYTLITDETANKSKDIEFSKIIIWMIINNKDEAALLSISFDDGKNYITMPADSSFPLGAWMLPNNFDKIKYKSSTVSVEFEILAGEV